MKNENEFIKSIEFEEYPPGDTLPPGVKLRLMRDIRVIFYFWSSEISHRTFGVLRDSASQRKIITSKLLFWNMQSIVIAIAGCNKLFDEKSIADESKPQSPGGLTDLLFDLYTTPTSLRTMNLRPLLVAYFPEVLIGLIVAYDPTYLEQLKIHLNKAAGLIAYAHGGDEQKAFYDAWVKEKDELFAKTCADNPVLREKKDVLSDISFPKTFLFSNENVEIEFENLETTRTQARLILKELKQAASPVSSPSFPIYTNGRLIFSEADCQAGYFQIFLSLFAYNNITAARAAGFLAHQVRQSNSIFNPQFWFGPSKVQLCDKALDLVLQNWKTIKALKSGEKSDIDLRIKDFNHVTDMKKIAPNPHVLLNQKPPQSGNLTPPVGVVAKK